MRVSFSSLLVLVALVRFPSTAVEVEDTDKISLLAQCLAQACERGECELPTTCCLQQQENDITECRAVCDCTKSGKLLQDPQPCQPLPTPSLHCHEFDLLSVSWSRQGLDLAADNVYLLEAQPRGGPWRSANITRRQIGYVRGLQPASEYRLRVTSFGPNGRRCTSTPSAWLATTDTSDHVPDAPPPLKLDPIDYGKTPVLARFSWAAGEDPACRYLAQLFPLSDSKYHEKECEVYESPREVTFKVEVQEVYHMMLSGLNPSMTESNSTKLKVETKSCVEALGHHQCKPEQVLDVTVSAQPATAPSGSPSSFQSGDVLVDVMVSWRPLAVQPLRYRVRISDGRAFITQSTVARANVTVPGNVTSVTIQAVYVSPSFFAEVWAETQAGAGHSGLFLYEPTPLERAGWATAWLVVAACTLFLAVSAMALVLVWHRRAKARVTRQRRRIFEDLDRIQKVPDSGGSLIAGSMTGGAGGGGLGVGLGAGLGLGRAVVSVPYSTLEGCLIPAASLLLLETLGAGCFGTVCKGVLTSPDGRMEDVAVKRLRDDATAEEVRQFSFEIALMKSVGQHRNIVSMVGCCVDSGVTLLVVEYCALGDLQRFLREAAKAMSEDNEPDLKYIALCHSDSDSDDSYYERETRANGLNAVSNATYGLNLEDANPKAKRGPRLHSKDLLAIARQVAIGMEFLASTRVVHRDLAARNVLVCEDRTVKISDFGLSRDIYEQNVYHQSGFDKVPIKWMAMESLMHREYTTQSDVWSFGVLLWEIVTFGGSPYPSIPNNGLFQLLQRGYRMERPANCSQELYEVMRQCWREKPSERPTFTDLKKSLDELLESAAGSDGAEYLPLCVE